MLRLAYASFVFVLGSWTSSALAEMPPNFKVAFIGDSGDGDGFRDVLSLIKREGTDLVLHQGDFDYDDDPEKFDSMISETLGESFPYLGSIGNHDEDAWEGYQERFQERLEKVDGLSCTGDLGVNAACEFNDFFFVLSGVGTMGEGHEDFIREAMGESSSKWKFCSWHKNMAAMQVGGKDDETGWGVYEACREAGAFIGTGHEHSYSRTHLLSDMEHQTIASRDNTLVLEPGNSFVFVSGLGGKGPRSQDRDDDHWASIYTSDQDAKVGALFCEFNVQGAADMGHCYFKNVEDEVIDEFQVRSAL